MPRPGRPTPSGPGRTPWPTPTARRWTTCLLVLWSVAWPTSRSAYAADGSPAPAASLLPEGLPGASPAVDPAACWVRVTCDDARELRAALVECEAERVARAPLIALPPDEGAPRWWWAAVGGVVGFAVGATAVVLVVVLAAG